MMESNNNMREVPESPTTKPYITITADAFPADRMGDAGRVDAIPLKRYHMASERSDSGVAADMRVDDQVFEEDNRSDLGAASSRFEVVRI